MNLRTALNIRYWNLKLFILITPLVSACGLIGTGGGAAINDPVPSGTMIYSGSFESNNYGVTGQAYVYVSGSSYIVRLENFTTSGVAGLRVLGKTADNNVPLNASLRGTSGNQNYSVGSTSSGVWTRIQIQNSTLAEPNNIYATAILSEINPSFAYGRDISF